MTGHHGERLDLTPLKDGPRKFVKWSVVWFVILCATVLALNMTVNPYGIYPFKCINPVVWMDRREKLELLRECPEKPELIVLGSSRMMRVDPRVLQPEVGLRGFNLAVNHARTEDFLALLRYCVLKLEINPKIVIVGLDIHAFRGFYQSDNLLEYYPELSYYIENERRDPLWFSLNVNWIKFTKGLSFHQTEMSARAVQRYFSRGPWKSSVIFDNQGTLIFNASEEGTADSLDSNRLTKALAKATTSYNLDFSGFGGISESRTEYFRMMAAFCRSRNTHLIAVLLPYHPNLIKNLKDTEFERLNAEWNSQMRKLATEEGVTLVDAQDIESFGGDPGMFFDEIHMFSENSNRMATYALRRAGQEEHHSF
jgi:hypothetical protein